MDLNTIQKKIENMGYTISLRKDSFFNAGIAVNKDEQTGIIILEKVFSVSLVKNKILITYPYYQIDLKKEFDDFEKLSEFILKEFTLKE